jgi:hypothetical protein
MGLVSSWVKSVVGDWVPCLVYSHSYLSWDRSVGKTAAPDVRCTPILLVLCLFYLVLGGTWEVYAVNLRRESLSGSLSPSSM